MNISIVTGPWFPIPPLQGGSVARLWHGLAEEFSARNHNVTVFCRSYPSQPDQEVINNVTYLRRGGFPQSRSITLDLLKDLIYAIQLLPILQRSDILIINDFWLPVFATLFRPDAGQIVFNANRFPKKQYFLYGGVSLFTAASNAIESAIIQQYPAATSRTQVIHNPINTEVFCPSTPFSASSTSKIILYVGRIHPEKGVHLLIEAFAILVECMPNVKLKVLGPVKEHQGGGGDDYYNTLQSKALGLPIEFLDPIFDQQLLADVYRSANLFCYPSLAEKGEAFGVAPLEAMATGLVPIVSNLDCFRDFIEDGKTGYYFNHRSSEAASELSKVLATAIMNWDVTSKMGLEAIQIAQRFSYSKIADLYLESFEKLLNTRELNK
jgi:glycosyltransferase involved in cell wall biosynthesis